MDGSSQESILTINAGSSSIKFALHAVFPPYEERLAGQLEAIGRSNARLTARAGLIDEIRTVESAAQISFASAITALLVWLERKIDQEKLSAIGHRIVHGGPHYTRPSIITDDLLRDLRQLTSLDPEHLPAQLQLIGICRHRFPRVPHIACFDTTFFSDLPVIAKQLPIPQSLSQQGVRRYGFHGLSYAFLLEELARLDGPAAARGRLIFAHLGSGASLVALINGRPIDTTMGLTPASGIPMSTRSGDLDPGLANYLADRPGYDIREFAQMAVSESGLLGVSGISADMAELLAQESDNPQAKLAVDLFCYEVKKRIGSFVALLGGLDTFVFTGGIGEAAPVVRERIMAGLDHFGIRLDPQENARSASRISTADSSVTVRVIPANEAATIVGETAALLGRHQIGEEGSYD